MYPRTAAFDNAVVDDHVMCNLCEIRDPFNSNALLYTFNVTDGDVTVDDSSQGARRAADLNLVDPTQNVLIADGLGNLLSPATNEIWLYRGIVYPDGTRELINLGVFAIKTFILDDSGAGLLLRVSCEDRAYSVSNHPLNQDVTFPSGTAYVDAIVSLIRTALPSTAFNIAAQINDTMGTTFYETGSDPWKAAQNLADSIGCELFFDVYGSCILRKIPDLTNTASSWTFAEGTATTTVLYFNRQLQDAEFSNHVIVIGQSPNAGAPVRAEYADTNPNSFTYIGGRYGDRSKTIKDSSIKDASTAAARAFGEYQQRLGLAELVYISCIVHPVFELNDVVTLVRTRAKINGNYSVGKISIPLTNDRPMYLTMHKRLVLTG
jgi:hypothetical protein